MNRNLIVLAVTVAMVGCSTSQIGKGEIPTISSQSFSTNVPGEKIKIDKSCGWIQRQNCSIESIEAIGVAPSVGATRLLQEEATQRACMKASANIVRYVFGVDVNDNRTTRTTNKQGENQKDRVKSRTEIGQDVELSNDDPNKDTNFSVRESLINTDIESIRRTTEVSNGRLVGFKIQKVERVDAKTMSCTIAWNKVESQALKSARTLISGQ